MFVFPTMCRSSRGANPESVMMTAGDVTIGTTTWRDLLGVRVQCFNCNKEGLVRLCVCAMACGCAHAYGGLMRE